MYRSQRIIGIASCLFAAAAARADFAEFHFAAVNQSYSAFLPPSDPLVGQVVTGARIYLDVEAFAGSDAANFFTDITLPVAPDPGNTDTLVLNGSDLGWSGSGVFHHFEATLRFNGTFVARRYGAESPNDSFAGRILDTSRIELDYIPEPAAGLLVLVGLPALLRRRG